MDDEQLNEFVKEKSVHDFSHPKDMEPKLKQSIWKSIGAEMNREG